MISTRLSRPFRKRRTGLVATSTPCSTLVLAAIQAPLTIHWTHAEVSAKNMGPDFDILVGVLKDAEAEPRSLFKLYLTEGPAKAETIGKDV